MEAMKARCSSATSQVPEGVASAHASSASTCSRRSEISWWVNCRGRVSGLASPCQPLPGALMSTPKDRGQDKRCVGRGSRLVPCLKRPERAQPVPLSTLRVDMPAAAAPQAGGPGAKRVSGAKGGGRLETELEGSHSWRRRQAGRVTVERLERAAGTRSAPD